MSNDNGAGPTQPDPAHDHLSRRQRVRRRGSDPSVLKVTGPIVALDRMAYLPADDRRATDAYGVLECPFCEGAHLHRGKPGIRRAPCRGGRYFVGPVAG